MSSSNDGIAKTKSDIFTGNGQSGICLFSLPAKEVKGIINSVNGGDTGMKYSLKLIAVLAFSICFLLTGCSRRSSAYTAESYFTYEDQIRSAGYTKRRQVMYVAPSDKSFETAEALKEAVGTVDTVGVVEWEGSDNKYTSYNLTGDDNTKIGAVTYTCRYAGSGERIARIGNGSYTEYTYKDKKIQRIARYDGEKKTAGSEPVMTMDFKYDSDGHNMVISVNDKAEKLVYDYKLSYDEKGKLTGIVYTNEAGIDESRTELKYNDKGLIVSSSRYGKENKLLVYTEYTYE